MDFDLELYREYVEVEPGIHISFIDIAPERPLRTYLLIHGFGGNARQWQYQINKFAQQNHVIAIDLRGHGSSSKNPSISYRMEDFMADISSVLEKANAHPKLILIGHSFGVAVATEYAVRYSEKISHLMLIAGAGEYSLRWFYRMVFRLPAAILSATQRIADNFIEASLISLQKIYFQNLRDWRGWNLFPQLNMPTLIILGNRDYVLPQEVYLRVAELIPQDLAEVVTVNVSAHLVMLERRDAVNRAIDQFVQSSHNDGQNPRWRSRLEIGTRGSLLKERPWLAFYDSDVPGTIHVPNHPITRLLQRSRRRFPKRTAFIESGKKLTYSALHDEVLRLGNALSQLGMDKQSRIMIVLPNCLQMVIAYYGILEVGGIAAMGNPLADLDELVRQLSMIEAHLIITWKDNPLIERVSEIDSINNVVLTEKDDYAPWMEKVLSKNRDKKKYINNNEKVNFVYWADLLSGFKPEPINNEVEADDTAVIQFTGGITSPPKGVKLSHKNLVANVFQMHAWFHDDQDGQEKTISLMPISHIYGMTTAMNYPISRGATCLLLPEFQIETLLQAIKKFEPTFFPGIPSIYMALKDFPDVRRYNVGAVRKYLSSVSPLPVELEEAFEKVTKSHLIEAYGLTEAGPLSHISPLDKKDKIGSIGLPLPSTEARIVDLNTKRVLPPGQVGELLIRGPQIMQGYWRDQEATEMALDKLGWLSTGDIARMDTDGYFQIISKSQEVWHSSDGDKQYYPRDIEEIIYELPYVEEVVVVILVGKPVAFVKVKDKSEITPKTIIAYCRRRLPAELVPWRVVFAGDFPRNLIGRVRRQELASEYEKKLNGEIERREIAIPGLVHQSDGNL